MCFCRRDDKECYICYSIDGKTDEENLQEMMFNTKTMAYPLISMANAYGCACIDKYTHNKCIIGINKCPTCRKQVNKPNLYIKTRYDYYCPWLLNWLKTRGNISSLNWFMINVLMLICSILLACSVYQDTVNKFIPPRSKISLLFASIIAISFYISLYSLTIFNDYLVKYWLYNKYTHNYDVL